MSRPMPPQTGIAQLISHLDLEPLGNDVWRGHSPDVGWQRVFGGHVIAQAVVAVQRSVKADRHIHSLHSYFLRPGDPRVPIDYQVERIRDGQAFATRRAVAIQHGKAIFALSASFQIDEAGHEHQFDMPDVPDPDGLQPITELYRELFKDAPAQVLKYWLRDRPLELRPVTTEHYLTTNKLEPKQNIWVRPVGEVPDDRALQSAILAYLSDMTLLDTALFPHGASVFNGSVQAASIDHAMWFHRPVRFDDWLLYSQDSPSAQGARGLSRGSLFDRSGRLVASTIQEGLIRPLASA